MKQFKLSVIAVSSLVLLAACSNQQAVEQANQAKLQQQVAMGLIWT